MKLGSYALLGTLSLGLSAQVADPSDWTGHYVVVARDRRGTETQTFFALRFEGNRVTGHVGTGFAKEPISEGKRNGAEFSFAVVDDTARVRYTTQYRARITAEGVRIIRDAGVGTAQPDGLLARRVDNNPPEPVPPKAVLPFPAKAVPWNGLAKTPPMGWNSWNKFKSEVSDKVVREIAEAMVTSGMKAAGYTYVDIDDTWEGTRDAQGNIRPNQKFPDMKALADFVHGLGLKFGIYSSPGPQTCGGYEGSFGHEEQDAKTYAAWGVDYVKYDWCSARYVYDKSSRPAVFAKMALALQSTGRPMIYSLSSGRYPLAVEWGRDMGLNLWRTTSDIRDRWEEMSRDGFDEQIGLEKYAGPGHWNDPDMLEVGNGGMTDTEYRTHMSLWCLLAAPLVAGNDLRTMTPTIREILTDREVLAVDQDALGKQAVRAEKNGDLEVWQRPLADGSYAVGLFNRGPDSHQVTASWRALGLTGRWKIRDLWAHADRGQSSEKYSAEVPSHGVVMVRLAR